MSYKQKLTHRLVSCDLNHRILRLKLWHEVYELFGWFWNSKWVKILTKTYEDEFIYVGGEWYRLRDKSRGPWFYHSRGHCPKDGPFGHCRCLTEINEYFLDRLLKDQENLLKIEKTLKQKAEKDAQGEVKPSP